MPPSDPEKPRRKYKPRPLNANQIAFVDRYLATHPRNGTQAYLAIYGGGRNAAGANSARLLKDDRVLALIAEHEAAIAQPFRLTRERIREEMALLSHSDVRHYQVDAEGNLGLAPGAPESAMRAVKQLKITRRTIPQANGKPAITEVTTEFRLWDKPSMVRLSSQTKGMIKKASELTLMPPGGPRADDKATVPTIKIEIMDAHDGKPGKAKSA